MQWGIEVIYDISVDTPIRPDSLNTLISLDDNVQAANQYIIAKNKIMIQ